MAEYAINGDIATLLGGDHTTGDPAALWLESSEPILVIDSEGRTGGKVRVPLNADGTFTVTGLPETVSGASPLYRLHVDSLSLRQAGQRKGMVTGWFPLTANRDLAWIVANYVQTSLITAQVAADVAAAAALGATNDTATASFVTNPASATTAALSATYETQTRANNRAIQVADYGTLGTADDSATITAALSAAAGRTVVFPPNAVLNAGQSTLSGVSNVVVEGNGATLDLIATGARIAGLNIAGVCDNVEVRRLRVTGNGVVADAHAGISSSGATLTNIRIIGCQIVDTTLGIGFSADGSGSIRGLLYDGNHIKTVHGTTSGHGYGLHVAISDTVNPSGVRMVNNTVESAQRHSIYCAKANGADIIGNHLLNHRDANPTGAILPALTVARSAHVVVLGNVIQRPAGGGLMLGGPNPATIAGPYVAAGNMLSDPQDAAALVYIGQQAPSTEGIPDGVMFCNNTMTSPTVGITVMTVWNGKRLTVRGNTFKLGVGSSATALALAGTGVTGNDYMDDVAIEDNLFDVDANTAIRISSGHETDTTKYRFRGNRRVSTHNMFTLSAACTNPNIDIQDQLRTGLTLSGVTTAKAQMGGPVQLTAPTAGAAAALPATPAGYLTVTVNNADVKVPYYS